VFGQTFYSSQSSFPAEKIMTIIEFLCPNGHKIRCQADQAGQPAKCPRCSVKFRVPDANELEAGGSDAVSKLDINEYNLESEAPPQAAPPAFFDDPPIPPVPKKETQMEFLCPNGHRLFGSVNLAGRPGECPDCGSRFRIPAFEEVFVEPKVEPAPRSGRPNGQAGTPASAAAAFEELAASYDPQAGAAAKNSQPAPSPNRTSPAPEPETMPATVWSLASDASIPEQPLASLFAKLWTTRPKGTRVELHMREGEMIIVERFITSFSQQTHGVFGIKASDSTYTLMAVPWESVTRVLVRGLIELPKT
jgi:hypothetical protein